MSIELKEVVPDSKLLKMFSELHELPYARLTITDSGYGMDKMTMDRIFEPFFTTKSVNKGTGLGLSVVHGIISSYNGMINVESHPGKGSSFQIFLPVIDKNLTGKENRYHKRKSECPVCRRRRGDTENDNHAVNGTRLPDTCNELACSGARTIPAVTWRVRFTHY
jgi:hypothetical protein